MTSLKAAHAKSCLRTSKMNIEHIEGLKSANKLRAENDALRRTLDAMTQQRDDYAACAKGVGVGIIGFVVVSLLTVAVLLGLQA